MSFLRRSPALLLPALLAVASLAAALVATPASTRAATYVTEGISADTIWNLGGSPYVIQADILVGNHADLTINPGVTVAFDGDYHIEIGWWSRLFAEGTPGQQVLFTSNAPSPAASDWDQIKIVGPELSTLTHCTFEYADKALYVSYLDPPITSCVFRDCRVAVVCYAASPPILACNFLDCNTGIFITNNLARPSIHDCNFANIQGWTVHVQLYPAPLVTIDAENNWWGTTDSGEIADTIHDHIDDDRLHAVIDFDPWRGTMPVERATWGGVKSRYR